VWQTNWASVNHRPGRRNYNVLGQRLVVHKKKNGSTSHHRRRLLSRE
jgi:hypothetical protein